MCLAIIAYNAHPQYPFLLAHNRDEFYGRPAEPLQEWKEGWIGGRDLKAGGTWLAFAKDGRYGFVTNFRDLSHWREDRATRGELVPQFLRERESPEIFVENLLAGRNRYNSFNLVVGRARVGALALSSPSGKVFTLSKGIHAISNGPLETSWFKMKRAKELFEETLREGRNFGERLFDLLADEGKAPAGELPSTGLTADKERLVSSIFVRSEEYGTVASTVATLDSSGLWTISERGFAKQGSRVGDDQITVTLQ